jgi:energy-coupling factor transport system permease protein
MWLLFAMLLIINLFTIKGEVLFEIRGVYIYKDAILQTIYVFLRIVMLLMVSTLLSSSTTPSELTYALEFYLKPLKIFKINIYEIAIMVSIALRFIPTLIEEMERIKKAQTSRGIDFENGKYVDKLRGLTSLIIPLFISCFDKADELTNAMVARGYDSDMPRSRYKHLSTSKNDLIGCFFMIMCLVFIIVINGVVL